MILKSYKTIEYSDNNQMQLINYSVAGFHLNFCKSVKEKSVNILMSDLSCKNYERSRNLQFKMDLGKIHLEIDEDYHGLKSGSEMLLITEEMIYKDENQSLGGIMLRLIPEGYNKLLSLTVPGVWQKIGFLDSLFFPFDINQIYCRTRTALKRIPNYPPIVLWDWMNDPFELSISSKDRQAAQEFIDFNSRFY